MSGLLKAIHIEDSRREQRTVRCKVIDSPAGDSTDQVINAILRELAADEPEVEVGWSGGERCVVRPIPTALPARKPGDKDPYGGTWVVTGGARGITAIAARGSGSEIRLEVALAGCQSGTSTGRGLEELLRSRNEVAQDSVGSRGSRERKITVRSVGIEL